MVNYLAISVLIVFSVLAVVAIGRAIAGSRFERELRLVALNEEDRLRGTRPIALRANRDGFSPGAARQAGLT